MARYGNTMQGYAGYYTYHTFLFIKNNRIKSTSGVHPACCCQRLRCWAKAQGQALTVQDLMCDVTMCDAMLCNAISTIYQYLCFKLKAMPNVDLHIIYTFTINLQFWESPSTLFVVVVDFETYSTYWSCEIHTRIQVQTFVEFRSQKSECHVCDVTGRKGLMERTEAATLTFWSVAVRPR